jgi:hypothetical protein
MTNNFKGLAERLANEKLLAVLEAIPPFGVVSHRSVASVRGLTEKQVIYAFARLLKLGAIEQLQCAVVYATKNGRPEKPYALTALGARTLSEMGHKEVVRPVLDGPLDVAHRFCMALVGSQSDNPVQIEKVIPYAPDHYVRTDVYVPLGEESARLLEIEQALDSNHKSRATAKLRQYGELFATHPSGIIPEVMIVFNLPKPALLKTLKVWQSALQDVGELPLTVYYSTLSEFLSTPSFADWSSFERLTPSEKKRHARSEPAEADEELLDENPRNEVPMAELVGQIQVDIPIKLNDEAPMRLYHFGALALAIHQLDFGEDGQTALYAAHPVNSLGCLREFLHSSSQCHLLDLIKREMKIFRKQNGVTMLRHASTRLAWAFLHYFGFGRGGPLTLFVRVPEMGENTSEIRFELLLIQKTNNDSLKPPEMQEKSMQAISWLLSALIIYPEELGLTKE